MGLSKHLIECYPTTTAEEVSVTGTVCDICLNEYKAEDLLRTIPCLHRFHTKCIDKWLKVKICISQSVVDFGFLSLRKTPNVQCVAVI